MKNILIIFLIIICVYLIFSFSSGGFSASVSDKIIINAPSHKIWNTLTDYENYSSWNRAMKFNNHDFGVGNEISFTAFDENGKEMMTMKPTVMRYEKNKAIVWKGKLYISGIFDGTHQFYLKDFGNGSTEFTQKEDFSGLLIPIARFNIIKDTQDRFVLMDKALKNKVEAK